MPLIINFDDIHKYKFTLDEKYEVIINYKEIDFHFYFHLKSGSKQMIFFSNGALDLKRSKPPVFQRKSWSDEFSANTIFIDDRTLHDSNLVLGWGQGRVDRFYLDDISDISKEILRNLKINAENTAYFGSSAGGFMSLVLASKLVGSTAIVNNPQTYVYNYLPGPVNSMFRTCYPGLERDEIINKFNHRLSAAASIKQNGYVPKIYYFQNKQCEADMNNHFIPFTKEMEASGENIVDINYILYNNEKLGHNPLPKERTINWVIKGVSNFSNEVKINTSNPQLDFSTWLGFIKREYLIGDLEKEKDITVGDFYLNPNSLDKAKVAKNIPRFNEKLTDEQVRQIATYFYTLYKPDYKLYSDVTQLPRGYAFFIMNLFTNGKASKDQCRDIIKLLDEHQKLAFNNLISV